MAEVTKFSIYRPSLKIEQLNQTITYGSVFLLGVGAGWIIEGHYWNIFLTSYIPALATLLAAFYGAKYAFKFQNDKDVYLEKKLNLVNANKSIFSLMRMANTLAVYRKEIINPIRNSPTIFLEMPPTLQMEKEFIKLDIESLYFMLETDDRNLLGEVIVEEERYRSTLDAINKRSELHLNEVQPLLERANFVEGGEYSLETIQEILKPRLYSSITQLTEQVLQHVDSTIESLQLISNKLHVSVKKQFPNDTVIKFSIPQ